MSPKDFRDHDNVVPFPREMKRAPRDRRAASDRIFNIGDRVQFLSDGRRGWISEAIPKFGEKKRWLYTVMIEGTGMLVMAYPDRIEPYDANDIDEHAGHLRRWHNPINSI